ncbi:MAG: GNAT family N-acetyltransferase [Terriglobia bacterium]
MEQIHSYWAMSPCRRQKSTSEASCDFAAQRTTASALTHERSNAIHACVLPDARGHAREVVLIAEHDDRGTGQRKIIAVGRWNRVRGTGHGEPEVLVSDEYQDRGVETELFGRLVEFARAKKIHRVFVEILQENIAMQHVAEKLGFQLRRKIDEPTVNVTLDL